MTAPERVQDQARVAFFLADRGGSDEEAAFRAAIDVAYAAGHIDAAAKVRHAALEYGLHGTTTSGALQRFYGSAANLIEEGYIGPRLQALDG